MAASRGATARRAAALLVVGAVTLGGPGAPREASAFCRTTTKPVTADFNPASGRCWDQGLALFWKNSCVSYNVHREASRQISYDDASETIAAAFTKWTGATCPTDGTGTSRASIDVRDMGPVNCGAVQYNSAEGNQHVIVFRDQTWPHDDPNNTLALTTVTFNPDTGEIYDADMEVNTAGVKMSVGDPVPFDGYDFAAVITHEAGHFLGLAHSGDARATMFAHYDPGSTVMRNLAADDVTGICTVYRPDGSRAIDTRVVATGLIQGDPCDPTPRRGFSTECRSGASTRTACSPSSIGAARASSSGPGASNACSLAFAFAAVSALAARRARGRGGKPARGR